MKRASLSINVDLESSLNNLSSTYRSEGLTIASDSLRVDGEHVDMEVCLADLVIDCKIGQGACSSVNRAFHKRSGKPYAVKMFNVLNRAQRGQLFKEIHLLKDVSCEALVSFCGAFHTDGFVGVILEYMDRGSLDRILTSPKAVSETALAGMMFQIFWGLGYLHHDKNVHRDVKPGNALMNSQGFVKLSDFGISRTLDGTAEMSNTYVGTFRFMSPERLLGEGYNCSGDVWSAGIMIMELWTKTCPFKHALSSPLKLLEQLESMESILGEASYPPLLTQLLQDMLRLNPIERPTASQCLQSAWFESLGVESTEGARRCVREWLEEAEDSSDYSDDFEDDADTKSNAANSRRSSSKH